MSVIQKSVPATVFVCIGTPRIVGDSVGPRVGSKLIEAGVNAYVYGTLERPITALNLHRYRKMLAMYHRGDVIVTIDATMGMLSDIGSVKLCDGGLRPAGAFRRRSAKLGDVGVMAIVGEREGDMLLQLKVADEAFVAEIADEVFEVALAACRS